MKKVLLVVVMVLAMTGGVAYAQGVDTKTINVTVHVGAVAQLTLGTATLTFPNSDPDTVPSISATEGDVAVTAKLRTSSATNWTLTVKASGANMTDAAGDTIAVSALTWTHTGAAFSDGIMDAADQPVATQKGSGTYAGTQAYRMANSWTYATGSYSTTLTYTLTAV